MANAAVLHFTRISVVEPCSSVLHHVSTSQSIYLHVSYPIVPSSQIFFSTLQISDHACIVIYNIIPELCAVFLCASSTNTTRNPSTKISALGITPWQCRTRAIVAECHQQPCSHDYPLSAPTRLTGILLRQHT
jgi:hypothetical protein